MKKLVLFSLLFLLTVGCSQKESGSGFYNAFINNKEVHSIEIFDTNTNDFIVQYFDAPEKQYLSSAIENAETSGVIDDRFEYKLDVKYTDKSSEQYWLNGSESRFKMVINITKLLRNLWEN